MLTRNPPVLLEVRKHLLREEWPLLTILTTKLSLEWVENASVPIRLEEPVLLVALQDRNLAPVEWPVGS